MASKKKNEKKPTKADELRSALDEILKENRGLRDELKAARLMPSKAERTLSVMIPEVTYLRRVQADYRNLQRDHEALIREKGSLIKAVEEAKRDRAIAITSNLSLVKKINDDKANVQVAARKAYGISVSLASVNHSDGCSAARLDDTSKCDCVSKRIVKAIQEKMVNVSLDFGGCEADGGS